MELHRPGRRQAVGDHRAEGVVGPPPLGAVLRRRGARAPCAAATGSPAHPPLPRSRHAAPLSLGRGSVAPFSPSPPPVVVGFRRTALSSLPWRHARATDDVVEIQQLLARYAVGMTKDDIDAVIGRLHARRQLQRLRRHLLAGRLPHASWRPRRRACSWSAPPAIELDGDTGTGRAAAVLRRPDQPRHAHRLVHRHLPAHRRRLAAAHPLDDVPAQERRPRLRSGPRPHPPDADARDRGRTAMELDEFRDGARPLARRARRPSWRPAATGESLDEQHGPPVEGEAPHLRRRLDAVGLARAGRRPRRLDVAARLPRRGADRRAASWSRASTR